MINGQAVEGSSSAQTEIHPLQPSGDPPSTIIFYRKESRPVGLKSICISRLHLSSLYQDIDMKVYSIAEHVKYDFNWCPTGTP